MIPETEVRVTEQALRRFCISVLERLGVSPSDAGIWTEVIVETSLRGVDSHGILVLPMYAEMLEAGGIRVDTPVEVINDQGSTLLLDGGNGIGSVVANQAMDLALDRAQKFGLSFVSVRNSNHFRNGGLLRDEKPAKGDDWRRLHQCRTCHRSVGREDQSCRE